MIKSKLNFGDQTMASYIAVGKAKDDELRRAVDSAIDASNKKVEAKRHTMISGTPGVGKTHSTMELVTNKKKTYVRLEAGMSDIAVAIKLGYAVGTLDPQEELVCVIDDADDIIFGDEKSLNKWKQAMQKTNEDTGILPTYDHAKAIEGLIFQMMDSDDIDRKKMGMTLKKFLIPGQVGLSIPTNRVRFVILCNTDYSTIAKMKNVGGRKLINNIQAVCDRLRTKHISMSKLEQWGWLAYVLENTQPFEKDGYLLEDNQKLELLKFLHTNWERMKSTTFRQVEEMAEAIINNPYNYNQVWNDMCLQTAA